MKNILIIYPAIAMFTLTMSCIFYLGFHRYRAIHNKQVKISYYRTYDEGSQPQRLHLLARHVQNHFEVPPLFYIVVILIFVSNSVTVSAVILSWLFVALRAAHSYIHLGSNNVSIRFFTFGASLLVLSALWITLLLSIVGVSSGYHP